MILRSSLRGMRTVYSREAPFALGGLPQLGNLDWSDVLRQLAGKFKVDSATTLHCPPR